ncbi:MAG: hypothetical protein H0V30_07815 [Chitinophagaceae bacterium]|jgi:hypothetical protein|nr:hypothetical protein [Chitinophagaceae bacterium]
MNEELAPFQVEYLKDQQRQVAEIKPCCKEDNVFYYDVFMDDEFQFSLTTNNDVMNSNPGEWKVAMRNADKKIDPALVQTLGLAIDFHFAF